MSDAVTARPPVSLSTEFKELWRLWRNEKSNPAPFYERLAERAAADMERWFGPLEGQRVVDLGCGPGWYTDALRHYGAEVIPMDHSASEMQRGGRPLEGGVVGDAMALPLEDGSVDGIFASNMLEHTPDSERVLSEMSRVVRPGGWIYVSWTNWYSPWGGHDMTPYHFLGPTLGLKMYQRRHGTAPKCVYGVSLWPVHIGPTLRYLRARPELRVLRVEPRYWPQLQPIVRVPLLRELFTWNCVVRMRKLPA